MSTQKFKTSLKCEGCVAKITSGLNAISAIKNWNVDLKNADKILTVEGEGIVDTDVIASLRKNGYTAERLPS